MKYVYSNENDPFVEFVYATYKTDFNDNVAVVNMKLKAISLNGYSWNMLQFKKAFTKDGGFIAPEGWTHI